MLAPPVKTMQRRCGFTGFLTLRCLVLLECLKVSGQVRVPHKVSDPHWHPATATWYGSPDGDGSDGGACGYGSLVDVKPLRARVGAVSPVLFKNGEGCGACYKVRCLDKSICSRRAVTIIVTDECPGGYCANGRTHFDLSGSAFGHMAINGESSQLRNRGELPVVYRMTPCKYPGKNIAFHVNEGSTDYWLSLLVEFEDGDGDVGSMHIRECFTESDVLKWRSFYATQDDAWEAHYQEVFGCGIREALCCLGRAGVRKQDEEVAEWPWQIVSG